MATVKTANGRGKYHDLNSRQDLISYICNPQKTPHHHIYYSHVSPNHPVEDMDQTAAQFGKAEGVQARHFIFSFHPLELDSHTIAAQIAQEVTDYLGEEYQSVSAVHEDQSHLHIHTVINAVSHVDGHRYRGTKQEFYAMKNQVGRILRRYGMDRLDYISSCL